MSRAVRYRSSPCSVRIRPRAWRWNSITPSCSSSAPIWREIADWLSFSPSPACVKLPASATAWKMRSLSQSINLLRGLRHPRLLAGQPLLGFERRHAARPGGGDSLAEDLVLHVACRVDTRDIGGGRVRLGQEVSLAVHCELALEQLGVG